MYGRIQEHYARQTQQDAELLADKMLRRYAGPYQATTRVEERAATPERDSYWRVTVERWPSAA